MWSRLIICLAITCASSYAVSLHKQHPCDEKECRSGRECVVVEGEAQCLCIVSCPDHFKPVCGTDGISYDNHCRLHQKACVSGHHIGIEHKGYCKSNYNKQWKKKMEKKSLLSKHDLENELQNDLIEILKKNENKKVEESKRPAVCYTPQRNALRYLIVEHFEEDLKEQSWYSEGMTYRESLWGWFYTCDEDKNNFVNAEELLACSRKVDFFARPGQDNELTKELCIDALVDDGDKNRDWKLDFEEFTTVMDPKYEPKEKKCSLEGREYLDGEEINVDCNHCVCAVGNWVCASTVCPDKGSKNMKKKKNEHRNDYLTNSHPFEVDNALDDSNAVISHVSVADLWMEKNKKDKEIAKNRKKEEQFDVDDNLFADFDDEDKELDEKEKLHLDDYYDDLYEKSKVKKNKKKKFQLEKALKEVKLLRKKTAKLEKLLKQKESRKNLLKMKEARESEARRYAEKPLLGRPDEIPPVFLPNKRTNQPSKYKAAKKSKKYYDKVFEETNWNDLIDWGDMTEKDGKGKHHGSNLV